MLPNEQKQLASSFTGSYNHHARDSIETFNDFHCPSCPAKFVEKFELKTHMSHNHGHQMPFCCQLCGKGYLSYQGLKDHQMSFHEGKLFACPICDRKMNQKSNLKRHLRLIHKSEQCTRCLQIFHLEEFNLHISACC